jgi:hypothetical protein
LALVFNLSSVPNITRATIEGVTITGGYNHQTTGTDPTTGLPLYIGGGLLLPSNLFNIENCIISGNHAAASGGGMSYGTAINCTIANNTADAATGGGAIFATLEGCTISGNKAVTYGGGAMNSVAIGCSFNNNTASLSGGALCESVATNCAFTGNKATNAGGAIYNAAVPLFVDSCTFLGNSGSNTLGSAISYSGASPSTINNSLIVGTGSSTVSIYKNTSQPMYLMNCTIYNGNIYTVNSSTTLTNCIVSAGTLTGTGYFYAVTYSDIYSSGSPVQYGVGNINADPLFYSASSNVFRLSLGSPCINSGTTEGAPLKDVSGLSRVGTPDMGAYEYQNPVYFSSPVGGETYFVNSQALISWEVSDGVTLKANSIQLLVSYNNGATWSSLVQNGANNLIYAWNIPASLTTSNTCILSIEAVMSNGVSVSSISGQFAVIGTTVYVSPSGLDTNIGTLANPYHTIQHALTMVPPSGEVIVLGGTYNENNIAWPNNKDNITLTKIAGATTPATIDAQGLGRIMTIQGSVNATIEGINFVNGAVSSSPTDGGAIDSTTSGTLSLANCSFRNNSASNGFMDFWGDLYYAGNGGAIYASGPIVASNLYFINNLAGNAYTASYSLSGGSGGAIYSSSPVSLYNCVFSGNRDGAGHNNGSGGSGGAVFAPSGNIISCTFYENHAGGSSTGNMYVYGSGGALSFTNSGSVIENCIFWQNSAVKVYMGNVYDYSTSQINGTCTVTYSDLGPNGSIEATGNICTDPLFNNAANNDLSLTYLSPCVDAGATLTYPLTDINGNTRPQNGVFDMGAYEYSGTVIATNTRLSKGYYTIQKALSDTSLAANDVITLASGTINEHDIIWPNVNNITLRGTGSNETIISAEALGRAISVESSVNLSLEALTITYGKITSGNGGGIQLSSGCLLKLSKVNFIKDIAFFDGAGGYMKGGAIDSTNATVLAVNSTFANNSSYNTGGAVFGGTWEALNCSFQNNWGANYGGVADTITFTATNCVFSGNIASGSGGISNGGLFNLTNCLLINNQASSGTGSMSNTGIWQAYNCTFYDNSSSYGPVFNGSINAVNSVFWNNTYQGSANMANNGTLSYCDLGGETLGTGVTTIGCFSADPQFISSTDQHLGTFSPCLMAGTFEAGVPSFDLDGNVRSALRKPDLGVYQKAISTPVIDMSSLAINGISFGTYSFLPKRPTFQAVINDNYLSIKMVSVEVQIGPNTYFPVPQVVSSTSVMVMVTPDADLTGDSANISLTATNVFNLSDEFSKTLSVGGSILSISGSPRIVPNPIKPKKGIGATFIYDLSKDTEMSLMLFDITGRKIWQQTFNSGSNGGQMNENRVYWDGKSSFGQYVPNGVYIYILSSDKQVIKKGQVTVID